MVSLVVRVLPYFKDGFDPLAPDMLLRQLRLSTRETVMGLFSTVTQLGPRAGEFEGGGGLGGCVALVGVVGRSFCYFCVFACLGDLA